MAKAKKPQKETDYLYCDECEAYVHRSHIRRGEKLLFRADAPATCPVGHALTEGEGRDGRND